tara:strand:+ start:163 stop:357 length:195 start_codon:yes stop_codon:yes gene_type:complete
LKGVRILEFKIPRIKKIIDNNNDQILTFPEFKSGHNDIIKNKIKKTIPKLLFEGILFCIISNLF